MMKILLFDQNELTSLEDKTTLENEGYEINVANNVEQFNEIIKLAQTSLILCNYKKGTEEVFKIKSDQSGLKNIPVLAYNEKWNEESLSDAFKLGVQDSLRKPFRKTEVAFRLGRYIKKD